MFAPSMHRLIVSLSSRRPVSGYFSKVEYKEDDFTRKKRMLLSEYNAHRKKTFARGLFHNKITVPNETFTADQAIFGPADPSPVTARLDVDKP